MTQPDTPVETGNTGQGEGAERSSPSEPGASTAPARAAAGDERGGLSLWQRLVRAVFPPSDGETIREDLSDALLSGGELYEAFSPGERAMLANILRLREVRVDDVMVPRADVEAVDLATPVGRLLEIFEESGRSRMPVYAETLDDPRGMVHIRDLLAWITKQARARRKRVPKQANGNGSGAGPSHSGLPGLDLSLVDLGKTLQESGIMRKVLFVPASMHATDLMQRMQANRTQMALVIDEYGGTDGLVSLEDIVEMVVGDIEDEHDEEEQALIRATAEDTWLVDAKAELEDVAEAIGPDFDIREQSEDVDTVGGLIFSELGRVPVRGEVVQAIPGFEVHVLDADPRRVKRVRILRRRQAARRRGSRNDVETRSGQEPGSPQLPKAGKKAANPEVSG